MAYFGNTREAVVVDLKLGGQIHYATLRELEAQQSPLYFY
jgi:hypothetical protein